MAIAIPLRNAAGSLVRKTTSGRFIPEIDGLRFVAITSVVVFHLSGYLVAKSIQGESASHTLAAILVSTGHCGVQLFFIISGFILALPWLESGRPRNIGPYFLRRLTRLEPPYFVSLVGLMCAFYITKYPRPEGLLRHFLASAAYLHSTVFASFNPANCVTWSLEVEIQFYALLPVLAYFVFPATRWVRRGILSGLVLGACIVSYEVREFPRLNLSLLGCSAYFFMGILLADLDRDRRLVSRSAAWDVLGIFGFALVPLADLWWREAIFPPVLLALASIFVATLRGRLISGLLSKRLLVTIGGMCYSIYLLHYPLISFIGRHSFVVGESLPYPSYLAIQLGIVVLLMLPIVLAFFLLIERPCMDRDWPKKLYLTMRGTRPVVQTDRSA
jgi:peptidoglycan/LPS O-acetylase OafA/YrhL